MKKYVILLLIIFQLKSFASQVPVGLTSNNVFTWSMWENDKGQLKHFLYLNNKSQKEVKIQIKLKKYKSVGTGFEEIKADKEIHKVFLPPNRITKIDYPINADKMSFMEFVEDGKSIGLLSFNMEEPQRSFVDNKYKYYTNAGTNGSKTGAWIRIVNVYDPHTELSIMSTIKNATDICFMKIVNSGGTATQLPAQLDSLQASDKSILKFDQVNNLYTVKLQGDFGKEKYVLFPVLIELLQNGKRSADMGNTIAVFKE
jgi:hypothetical protein